MKVPNKILFYILLSAGIVPLINIHHLSADSVLSPPYIQGITLKQLTEHQDVLLFLRQRTKGDMFVYFTRDAENELLKEPSGFPGHWTVEMRVPKEDHTNAAAVRLVKSFSLSLIKSGRTDISRAKFIVTEDFPGHSRDDLVKNKYFCIKRSAFYGIEVFIKPLFLRQEIKAQRELFFTVVQTLPDDLTIKPLQNNTITVHDTPQIKRVVIFNNPIHILGEDRIYPASNSATSLALGSFLETRGVDAEINDFSLDERMSEDDHIRQLKAILHNIDMVCISVYEEKISELKIFLKMLKKAKPSIMIAVGGPAPTIIPEHVTAHLPEANIVFRGDAEAGFGQIIDVLNSIPHDTTPDADDLAGMFQQSPGTVIHFGNVFQFNDLISINRITAEQLNNRSIDYSFINENSIDGIFSMMTSLGCRHKCIFCATGAGKRMRAMSPHKVIALVRGYQARLEELERHGAAIPDKAWQVAFVDDNFFYDPTRAIEIFTLWREAQLRVTIAAVQATLTSFTLRESGRFIVNHALIEQIASFKDIYSPRALAISLGTDALLGQEIRRLQKGTYSEDIIDQVMEAFEKGGLANFHHVILTNARTRIKDILMTFIRIGIFGKKYRYGVALLSHDGINPIVTTQAVNDLVERDMSHYIMDKEGLPALPEHIPGFDEFDCYHPSDMIHSEFIPDAIYRHLTGLWNLLQSAGATDKSVLSLKMLEYLDVFLNTVNLELIGLHDAAEWDLYKDLLDEDVEEQFRELLTIYGQSSMIAEIRSSHQFMVNHLKHLQARFNPPEPARRPQRMPRFITGVFSRVRALLTSK